MELSSLHSPFGGSRMAGILVMLSAHDHVHWISPSWRGFVAIVDSWQASQPPLRHLHLTQSTLSRQLQSLEDQCGTAAAAPGYPPHAPGLIPITDYSPICRALLALAEESEQRLAQ